MYVSVFGFELVAIPFRQQLRRDPLAAMDGQPSGCTSSEVAPFRTLSAISITETGPCGS